MNPKAIENIPEIYSRYFNSYPKTLSEIQAYGLANIDRLYDLIDVDCDLRLLLQNISLKYSKDHKFKKDVTEMVARKKAKSLRETFLFCRKCEKNIIKKVTLNKLQASLRDNHQKDIQNIVNSEIGCDRFAMLFSQVESGNLRDVATTLIELGIDVNKYYRSFLWPIFVCREKTSTNISEENIWCVGVLYDLFLILEAEDSWFNGVENGKLNAKYKYLASLYREKGNPHLYDEPQFSKYGLIEITSGRSLHEQTPRIIDTKFEISMGIKYLNEDQYLYLRNLFETNQFTLSFYPDCDEIYGFINLTVPLLEEFQYGKAPTIEELISKSKSVAKLTDFETMDSVFIKVSNGEITFEEVLENFHVFENSIVTKVLHAETFTRDENVYCNHIDLEFIFYSVEEYQKRIKPGGHIVKGTAFKRQKIFKIDSGNLDFGRTLYPLAQLTFKNKKLLNEYFANIRAI